jgi:PKD repeat protein
VPLDIYDEARNQLLSSSISNGISKLSLRPRININEYGINQFSGPGVSEDQMDPITAGVGSHVLSMVHSDRNGCTATVTREISIYDFTKAVNGLDTLYNSNHPVKISILRNGKGVKYSLESLTVSAPTSASLGIDISTSLTGPVNGNYVFNPKLFNTPSNRAKFGILGGRLGQLLFLGKYRNLVTGELENFTQSVAIYVPPRPSLTINQSSASLVNLCEDLGRAELSGLPKTSDNLTAFFTIDKTKVFPGLIDQFNGNGIVATDSVRKYKGYGVYTVRYIVQNTITKGTDTTSLTFRINPRPDVKFSWSTACVLPELVNFKNESTLSSGSIVKNEWNFGDNSIDAISTQASPSHGFKDARTYTVSLIVESDLQCKSKFLTSLVPVGGNPNVSFSFKGISTEEVILFKDSSSVIGDKIKSRRWEFGDDFAAIDGNRTTVERSFKNPGVYKVKLTAIGEIGCARTKTLDVGIVPKVVLAAESEVYEEFFNGSDGGWQTLRNPFNSVQSSSWKWLNSNSIIDPTTNGSGILKTQNSKGSYDELEDSFLFSPVFDFSALKRPVISFDFYNQLSPSDGVVLEYSTDGKNIADPTKNWKFTLGETNLDDPTGANWYNGTGLVTKPGDQPKGDYGWTQPEPASNKWVEARHALDVVDQRKQVVFRFALGSSDQAKQGAGFAIDNVRIGSRTRTVLLENFTSLSNTLTDSRGNIEKVEKQLLMDDARLGANIKNGVDVVRLNYHLSLPKEDPFNLDNPNELGARALFYNVTKTPCVQMDGDTNEKLFSTWINDFKLKTLDLAEADVSVSAQIVKDEGEDKGALKGTVSVKSRTKEGLPKDRTVLHIVLVEQKVDFTTLSPQKKALVQTGEVSSDYVVKKLYPTAAGTRFETDLKLNESRTFNFKWTPDFASFYPSDLTKPNLAIIAIVQNAFTKEVYQTAIFLNLEYPPLVTGIKEWTTEEISCYPNPTDKQLMVSLPALAVQPIHINLVDQLGRVVLQDQIEAGQKSKLLDTSLMADGIYLAEFLSQGTSTLRKRIVVKH